MSVSIHDILANDDHAVILHESKLTLKDRTLTAKYADVYHLRNGSSPSTGTWPSTRRPRRNSSQAENFRKQRPGERSVLSSALRSPFARKRKPRSPHR